MWWCCPQRCVLANTRGLRFIYTVTKPKTKKGGGDVSSNKTLQQDASSMLQKTLKFRIPVMNDS